MVDRVTRPPGQPLGAGFTAFNAPVEADASGRVAFRASYFQGLGNQGLYRGTGGAPLERLVDESGDFPVPGHPAADFNSLGSPIANTAGDIVFAATFGGALEDAGLFRLSAGALSTVLDFGDPVPAQPAADFFAAGSPSVNSLGDVAVAARYSGGDGDEGIYSYEASSGLLVTTAGSGAAEGRPRALNDAGVIVFRATLASGDEAIVSASR